LETFKVIFNPEETDGVFCISLVEEPAIDSHFIAMSKVQELKLATVDQEKRLLLGPVLIPDKLILRKEKGQDAYNITFPAETIRITMQNFAKQGYHNNSNLQHDQETKLSGVTFVESWIKEDDVNDKSVKYGYDEPIGTWFAMMKVDNDEVWNDYVKTGKVKGFSVEGLLGFEKINLNKSEMEKPKWADDFLKSITDIFAGKEKVELGKTTANEGSLEFEWEGETVTPGETQISMKDSTGELVAVPDGKYTVGEADAQKVWVVSGSIVTEVNDVEKEVIDETVKEETLSTDPEKIRSEKFTQEVIYASTEMAKTMAAVIDTKFAELHKTIETRLSKIEEAGEVVSLTKAKGEKQKPYEQMTAVEKFRYDKQKHS